MKQKLNSPDIEILTFLGYNKLYNTIFQIYGNIDKPILANYEHDLNKIQLGNIKNAQIAVKTLSHEYIHFTLNVLFDKEISHEFDFLVYSNIKKAIQNKLI